MTKFIELSALIAELETVPGMSRRLRQARKRLAPRLYRRGSANYKRMMRGDPPPPDPKKKRWENRRRPNKRHLYRPSDGHAACGMRVRNGPYLTTNRMALVTCGRCKALTATTLSKTYVGRT